MADKQSDVVKNPSLKRKKKRNKKKKSDRSCLVQCSEKLKSSTDEKVPSLQESCKNDSYGNNNFTFAIDHNEDQQSCSTIDIFSRNVNNHCKYNSHNINGYSPGAYRNRTDFSENVRTCDPSVFRNRLINYPFRPSNNFQHAPNEFEDLINEINFLKQENMRLTNALQNHTWEVQSFSEVDVIFKKKSLVEKFSSVVNKVISNLLSEKIKVEELDKFCDENRKSPEPLNECLFAVDSSANISLNSDIPVYDTSFEQILEKSDSSKNATPKSSARSQNCFNCDGDHHLNRCPYQPDYRKIALARRKAKSIYVPTVRYHVHGKNENYFKPGIISNELREALGLKNNQIPHYIYRMRILDYPPGWLHEAAVESSGMILYDSEGNALKEENCEDGEVDTSGIRVQYDPDKLIDYPGFNVPLPPNILEESDIFGLPPLQPHQLRTFVEKFMTKPDVRPTRKRKIILENNKACKIQRLEEDMEIENDSDDGRIEVTNDFVPPLPENAPPTPPPPPPPPPPESEIFENMILSKDSASILDENSASYSDLAPNFSRLTSCSEFSSGTASPSLAELEELKKKLVMQLDNNGDDEIYYEPPSNPPINDESNSNVIEDDKTSDSLYILDECVASDLSNLSSLSNSDTTPDKSDSLKSSQNKVDFEEKTSENSQDESYSSHSLDRTTSQSKYVLFGTPSVSRHSPYAKLPDYEKFSKDVSAHLPFENLPNSTGTYEKMKNVLKKVKDKLNSLMT